MGKVGKGLDYFREEKPGSWEWDGVSKDGRVVKVLDWGQGRSGFNFWLCHRFQVWSWVSHFIPDSLYTGWWSGLVSLSAYLYNGNNTFFVRLICSGTPCSVQVVLAHGLILCDCSVPSTMGRLQQNLTKVRLVVCRERCLACWPIFSLLLYTPPSVRIHLLSLVLYLACKLLGAFCSVLYSS